jgi:hypothetical protein
MAGFRERKRQSNGLKRPMRDETLRKKPARMTHDRLARECARLDPDFEKALAEEGMGKELSEWSRGREARSILTQGK